MHTLLARAARLTSRFRREERDVHDAARRLLLEHQRGESLDRGAAVICWCGDWVGPVMEHPGHQVDVLAQASLLQRPDPWLTAPGATLRYQGWGWYSVSPDNAPGEAPHPSIPVPTRRLAKHVAHTLLGWRVGTVLHITNL